MPVTYEDRELHRSIRLLGSVLGRVLKTQAAASVTATFEQLERHFSELQENAAPTSRRQLIDAIEALEPEAVGELVRLFNLHFSLLDIAEESFHSRSRRRQAERGGHYWPGSFNDTLLILKQAGVTAEKLQRLLDTLLYLPVLTAHPTEAKRRAVKSALRNIFVTHERLADPRLRGYFRQEALARLRSQIQLRWKTDEVRARSMGVLDEINTGLSYVPLSLFQATARVYRNFENALRNVYGEETAQQIRIPSFLRFRSWIGGDRDGNPNVKPEATAMALRLQAQTVLREYVRRLDELREQLCQSSSLCQPTPAFLASLQADRVRLGHSALPLEKP